MAKKVTEFAREYADREAIRDRLTRYSRGTDRIDRDAMIATFWPDAIDDHSGTFIGSAVGLVDFAIPILQAMRWTTHFLGNMLIEIDGEKAKSETYVIAYHGLHEHEVASTFIASARYVDEWEKRQDEWRISRRTLIIDWQKKIPDSSDWPKEFLGHVVEGGRKPSDRSYQVFNNTVGDDL